MNIPRAGPLSPGARPGGGTVSVGWRNLQAVAARIGLERDAGRPLGGPYGKTDG